jgi:hypothetical protein
MGKECSKGVPVTRCPLGPTSGRDLLNLSHLLRDIRGQMRVGGLLGVIGVLGF